MSEATKQPNDGIPPKLDLRKSGVLPSVPAAPSSQPVPGVPGGDPSATGKKKTTRIPLSHAEGEAPSGAPGGPLPKTIRLAPPPTAARPLTVPTTPPFAKPPAPSETVKRETSRIPLEAAFATDERASTGAPTAGQSAAVPKTIRIKRPGQAPTVMATRPPEAEVAQAAATTSSAEKSKTARVDISAVAPVDEGGQPTQRKTIKIRRPEGGGAAAAPRSVAVARLEAEAAERHLDEISAPGIVYTIVAAAAVLVACVLVYALIVQAFPSLNWSLPGKMTL